jgi:DNA-binding CsgD family transcriptional regulator
MTDGEGLRRFVSDVARATGFVEIAKLVCAEAAGLGVAGCTVSYHAPTGQPLLAVDNVVERTNEVRLSWVGNGAWQRDPLYLAMLARGGSVASSHIDDAYTLLTPILRPCGVLGSIRCVAATVLPRDVERELLMVGAIVSVRFAYLDVTALACNGESIRLTPRQRDVAELAASGLTNDEISDHLGISTNTVKNRLKEAFERLAVRSRVELVRALQRAPADVEVPFGISHHGAFAIARARSGPTRSGPGGAE